MNSPRLVAMVSGKGGSGKTILMAALATIMAEDSDFERVLLVDSDLGTGGLSYYLGLKQTFAILPGVAELLARRDPSALSSEGSRYIKPLNDMPVSLMPVGDHRRSLRGIEDRSVAERLADLFGQLRSWAAKAGSYDFIMVDCRGGIDHETIAVCQSVDDVILVVEPDTTSFQASRHLVEVLNDADVAHKLRGFIVNKVFEDPSVIARNGSATFGTRFLGAIPFDIATTRSFLVGDLPDERSSFYAQLGVVASRAYPEQYKYSQPREMSASQFDSFALSTSEGRRGGALAIFLLIMLAAAVAINLMGKDKSGYVTFQAAVTGLSIIAGVGVLGNIEVIRRFLGRSVLAYIRAFSRRT